jgi:predicted metal-dependent hydrolase
VPPIEADDWMGSSHYLHGIALFNGGYYWEAHEAWEYLWHAHGRNGPKADLLKGLIKLAAAGVKVRERQPHGVRIHARRASELLKAVALAHGPRLLGLDLADCAKHAAQVADNPPVDPATIETAVSIVFRFQLRPR